MVLSTRRESRQPPFFRESSLTGISRGGLLSYSHEGTIHRRLGRWWVASPQDGRAAAFFLGALSDGKQLGGAFFVYPNKSLTLLRIKK